MSLIITTPDAPTAWPSGTVITVEPIHTAGEVTGLTLRMLYKGKAEVITARTLADVWAGLTKLPTA
jgi:hypothetical protein